uniref:Uncharacterized protein n=1 Tax=Timema cristinae TaxID=61476 RepID=A0A7R9CYW6_TIMCR|nr:unnamed protein product [Timema cristinae]
MLFYSDILGLARMEIVVRTLPLKPDIFTLTSWQQLRTLTGKVLVGDMESYSFEHVFLRRHTGKDGENTEVPSSIPSAPNSVCEAVGLKRNQNQPPAIEDVPRNCTVNEVRVDPCSEAAQKKACKVKKGTAASINFDFTPGTTLFSPAPHIVLRVKGTTLFSPDPHIVLRVKGTTLFSPAPHIVLNERVQLCLSLHALCPPGVSTSSLSSRAYWASTTDIPFIGMDTDACEYTNCVTVAGQQQTYSFNLQIPSRKVQTVSTTSGITHLPQ